MQSQTSQLQTSVNLDFAQYTSMIQFWMEIDKLKQVERKTKILGQSRYENSAEHSWQLAIGVLTLQPFLGEHLDYFKMVKMMLIHDLVEIDAGDVIAFDLVARAAIEEKEKAAAERIFGLLPSPLGKELLALWQEFEAGETEEAQYAKMIDHIMPMILNIHNNGQSWRENGIAYEQVVKRGEMAQKMMPELWQEIDKKLQHAKRDGWLK